MTEQVTETVEAPLEKPVRQKKEKKASYVRPKKVVELWNSGVKDLNEIANQLMIFEAGVKLKKNVKAIRDHAFYVTNTKWALTEATRKGLITDYTYSRRPSRKIQKTESVEVKVEDSLIPTL